MMARRIGLIAAVFGWATILFATLSIANVPGDWGHSICGPWGCGPPTQALVACHMSWLVVLLPLAFVLRIQLSPQQRRRASIIAAGLAIIGLAAITAYELGHWWDATSQWLRPYFWPRVGFSIVTQVDLPLLELLIAGLVLALPRRRHLTPKVPQTVDS